MTLKDRFTEGYREYQAELEASLPRSIAVRRGSNGKLLEKHVEHAGDQLMAALGFEIVRLSQSRASRQTPGIPDRKYYHIGHGLTLWWEAKRPGGRQSHCQMTFQLMVESCGEYYALGGVDKLHAKLLQIAQQQGLHWKALQSITITPIGESDK